METKEQITMAVYDAIKEVNRTLEPGALLQQSPDTVLMGEASGLDSLAVVTLLSAIEENLQRTFNRTISVSDTVLGQASTTWTVAALTDSIAEMMDGG
jgi:acyl carrier protein